jgi:hypothetical protein
MRDLVNRTDLIEQTLESIGGRQNRGDPRNQEQRNQYILERETILKKEGKQEPDRELKQNAAKRENDGVLKRLPKGRVRKTFLIIPEADERHVTANVRFYGGVAKAQRQAIQDRIDEKQQTKSCDR